MSRRRPVQPSVPPLSPLPPPTAVLPVLWRWVMAAILCAYVGLTLGHLSVTPVAPTPAANYINAPDEAAHLAYVRAVAAGRLPSADETYEWHQPPLYYALAALFQGGGPHAIRRLSVLLGLLGLLVLYRAARALFPDDPVLAVLAAGFAALLPMRQALTAVASNDPLTELLFSLALLLLIYSFRNGFTLRRAGLLGLVISAALLTKATGLLLLPVVLAALYLLWREGETPADLARGGLWLLVLVVALTGWWYARNMQLYGELTPVRAFMQVFAGTQKAGDWIGQPLGVDPWTGHLTASDRPLDRPAYLGVVANWTFRTFWAAWTPTNRPGVPFFLPPTFYLPYLLFTLAAVAGLIKLHLRRKTEFTRLQLYLLWLLFLTIFLVLVSFAGFIWTFFQAQGRYLYPAMLPLALLAALGYRALLPPRYRDAATGLALALCFVLALAFLVSAVLPAYT